MNRPSFRFAATLLAGAPAMPHALEALEQVSDQRAQDHFAQRLFR